MIDCTVQDGVAELCLTQPPLNEIGSAMLTDLERVLDQLERITPRALILYSGLPRGFCAGADLRELYAAVRGRDASEQLGELSRFLDRIHAVMTRLDNLPMTTVGAIHGVCFGGGFELALTLDVLVADTTARFCFPELRLGLIPGFGGIPRLLREVPNAVVRDLLLTGRSIGAKKAAGLGLVSQQVAKGEALLVARELARQAARFAPQVVATAKSFIKDKSVSSADLAEEKRRFLQLFGDPRVVEALRLFTESEDRMPYLPEAEA
jgi:enoyl-CoA hydratase/carnithine racemase